MVAFFAAIYGVPNPTAPYGGVSQFDVGALSAGVTACSSILSSDFSECARVRVRAGRAGRDAGARPTALRPRITP